MPHALTPHDTQLMSQCLSHQDELLLKLCRSAALGISAACVSDCLSNGIELHARYDSVTREPMAHSSHSSAVEH